MPTQVLVTGITGFIGSHVAIQLLQRGYDVRGTLRSMARAAEIRAVIAGNLLSERDVVLRRLQRMGVQIIETRPEHFGGALISRYLEIKRRDML